MDRISHISESYNISTYLEPLSMNLIKKRYTSKHDNIYMPMRYRAGFKIFYLNVCSWVQFIVGRILQLPLYGKFPYTWCYYVNIIQNMI